MSMQTTGNSRQKYAFADLNQTIIEQIVDIQFEPETVDCLWQQLKEITLSETEQTVLNYIINGVVNERLSIMNEATLWARLNYPLLQLAETEQIHAWSEISINANLQHVTLHGVIDGVLGYTLAGMLQMPWLVIVEAKKGLGNKDPRYQLYGQILATAFLNQQSQLEKVTATETSTRILYGCYTVADDWTFVRAQITSLETSRPEMKLAFSREYAGRLEAQTILEILKTITENYSI